MSYCYFFYKVLHFKKVILLKYHSWLGFAFHLYKFDKQRVKDSHLLNTVWRSEALTPNATWLEMELLCSHLAFPPPLRISIKIGIFLEFWIFLKFWKFFLMQIFKLGFYLLSLSFTLINFWWLFFTGQRTFTSQT